jgi:hypothetical protein
MRGQINIEHYTYLPSKANYQKFYFCLIPVELSPFLGNFFIYVLYVGNILWEGANIIVKNLMRTEFCKKYA